MLLSYNGIAKLIYPRLKISILIVASLLQRLYKSCIDTKSQQAVMQGQTKRPDLTIEKASA